MAAFFETVWSRITGFLGSINIFSAIIDIALVAFLIYTLFKFVRDSRAEQLIQGIVLLLLVQLLSKLLGLQALSYLMSLLFDNGLILLAVIFQPELRRALEHAGQSRRLTEAFGHFGWNDTPSEDVARMRNAIDAVCGAVEILQRQKMGALIVFERQTNLGDIIKTGTVVNAEPSPELIGNVFFNKAPLHDGAMIIREGRVYAAGCILPLTDNRQLSSELGTRHRAAVGMSESSDAMIVVVSEETGAISLALSGVLKRNYSLESLHAALENGMLPEEDLSSGGKFLFWRRKRK